MKRPDGKTNGLQPHVGSEAVALHGAFDPFRSTSSPETLCAPLNTEIAVALAQRQVDL